MGLNESNLEFIKEASENGDIGSLDVSGQVSTQMFHP